MCDLIGQNPMVYYTGKPKKASGPRAINKTGYWSANNDFRKAKKQNELLTQPFLILKNVGFHILLQNVTIRYCHSFKSYKVKSWWNTVYISRRCQIAEKDNNCVNIWCRKALGKLNHVPTSKKTGRFSILDLFYVKIKFLNKEIVPKRDIWSSYGTKSAAADCKQAVNDDERCQSFALVFFQHLHKLFGNIDAITYFKPPDFTNRQILTLICGYGKETFLQI